MCSQETEDARAIHFEMVLDCRGHLLHDGVDINVFDMTNKSVPVAYINLEPPGGIEMKEINGFLHRLPDGGRDEGRGEKDDTEALIAATGRGNHTKEGPVLCRWMVRLIHDNGLKTLVNHAPDRLFWCRTDNVLAPVTTMLCTSQRGGKYKQSMAKKSRVVRNEAQRLGGFSRTCLRLDGHRNGVVRHQKRF
jgi:hypothetical protein